MRHVNDRDWTKFCNGALKYFETKWTKKLEDYNHDNKSSHSENSNEDDEHQGFSDNKFTGQQKGGNRKDRYRDDSKEEDDEEDEDQESLIENMLKTGKFQMDKKRDVIKNARPSREELDKAKDEKKEEPMKETSEYFDNQYWHAPLPIQDDLDDLLKSEGFEF